MNQENQPITKLKMELLDEKDLKTISENNNSESTCRSDKENILFKSQTKNESKQIISKINKMISNWVVKYKFHTKEVESKGNIKQYVTEFSNPSSQKPIPEATAIVNI